MPHYYMYITSMCLSQAKSVPLWLFFSSDYFYFEMASWLIDVYPISFDFHECWISCFTFKKMKRYGIIINETPFHHRLENRHILHVSASKVYIFHVHIPVLSFSTSSCILRNVDTYQFIYLLEFKQMYKQIQKLKLV